MNLSPIALFVYNRHDHVSKVISALKKNSLAPETRLFIFSDGPRSSSEAEVVNNVRSYCATISGFKDIQIFESPQNRGLAKSIIEGVTKVLTEFESVIVLEDDIVVSARFLEYMNWALQTYESNSDVISISGYSYPMALETTENYFLRITSSWGWATWKSKWKYFNSDATELFSRLRREGLSRYFDFDHSFKYMKMLDDCIRGKNNSWAIRWYASAVLEKKLTLYPSQTMVLNIGFDGSGTHCDTSNRFIGSIDDTFCNLKAVPVVESQNASKKMSEYFRATRPALKTRIISKLKRISSAVNRSVRATR